MTAFRFLTAGESHGPALGATVEGVPAGLALTEDAIAIDLARRQRATAAAPARRSSRTAPRSWAGSATAGPSARRSCSSSATATGRTGRRSCRSGRSTTRRPTALRAKAEGGNKRATPVTRVRPGHADLAGALKYGFNDVRNVLERASARETAARVAAGAVARAFLRELGIEVWSFTAEVGGVAVDPANCTRVARGGRRVAAALPRPRRRGAR